MRPRRLARKTISSLPGPPTQTRRSGCRSFELSSAAELISALGITDEVWARTDVIYLRRRNPEPPAKKHRTAPNCELRTKTDGFVYSRRVRHAIQEDAFIPYIVYTIHPSFLHSLSLLSVPNQLIFFLFCALFIIKSKYVTQ